jgi:hypothetical protein
LQVSDRGEPLKAATALGECAGGGRPGRSNRALVHCLANYLDARLIQKHADLRCLQPWLVASGRQTHLLEVTSPFRGQLDATEEGALLRQERVQLG